MIRPSIRQLSYLIAIEDSGSFIHAAENCGVTQSTLSAGIKELENILQQQLIIRGRKRASLTPFGQEVALQGRQIIDSVDSITARARQIRAPLSGALRMGIIPTIAPYFLPVILPVLARNFPELDLRIHEDITERLVTKLQRGTLDLLLMAFPYDTDGISQMTLFEEQFFLACPKGHAPKTTISAKDLDPDSLLLLDDGHCMREHALSACGLDKTPQNKSYSATSLQTLLQMVNSGYGMTLIPDMAAQEHLMPPNIDVIRFHPPIPSRQIGLAWKRGHPRHSEFKILGQAIARP